MTKAPAINIENLNKVYAGGHIAVKDLSLTIPKGSFFALLGPNGAGKSTVINILASIVSKTSGKVEIMGHDLDQDRRSASSSIGVVPQELVMDTFFPVEEALEISAGYYGIKVSKNKIYNLLKALGLYEKRQATAKQLSGGMKRRFLVAKAMIHEPKVLILDEPTAGVDIELREQLWKYVQMLNQNGTTIIITTHYLEEAQALCDRIAFINKGRIIKEDSKENLLSSLGSKEINFELASAIKSIPRALKKYNIEQVAPNKIKAKFHTQEDCMGEIISEIHKAKLVINDISISEADLQDVFKKVMQED